ncbi:DUF6216 family protein [Cellvibrio sp. pealriver]|uniref:DUF6216 family protein n=1 Tax=Cellvibrio sp. pealriver TaxID=1622269 RepID=UPI00066FD4B8|nr:DUF6216 family protein [Cellvibrio sp. pealriver]
MENTNLYEFGYAFLKDWAYILIPLLILIASPRARIMLVHYLWNKIFNQNFTLDDKDLNNHVKKQLDLEKIKIAFWGLNITSLDHAKAIIKWCEKYDLSLTEARAHSSSIIYNKDNNGINFKKPSFVKIEKSLQITQITLSFFLAVLIFSTPYLSGVFGFALIKTKETKHYLLINSSNTVTNLPIFESHFSLTSDCNTENTESSYLSKNEHTALCNLIKSSNSIEEYLQKSINKSLIFLLILLPPTIFWIYLSKSELRRINERTKIYEMTRSKEKSS